MEPEPPGTTDADKLRSWKALSQTAEQLASTTPPSRGTPEKIPKDQLGQTQSMVAIRQLVAAMAHDFNNLLGAIIGNLDLLQAKMPKDPAAQELLDSALEAALRGAELNRRLLAIARNQPPQQNRMDAGKAGEISVDPSASEA